ncbi:Acetyl-CoA carboxylase, biotin carboxyl carrier protein [uncultured Pleomorphomonas sp.]|uniref:Biotin carboxyl carrier protein of acetyl-CoA carboxylase n=1 Tax=uncultured Pleomorphomonas sp. TaxID=442121 RepID=A0A212L4B7_9HYPH|nr:biotin/lipoyl-containing protein [uncultured Pleomorphomonas sp.]SCM72412.1 Acetyl-CoA carboxylase, biotin carboxyl carrier protein [uncultured Pleomorphomonas sp.]
MDDALVDRLVALLHASGLREIEFEEGEVHIRLVKDGKGTVRPEAPAPQAAASAPEPASPQDHPIVAGLTGTFYRSPSPDAPPFVEIGDRVEEGQTIGLLEAMKMLNPIEADRAGRIAAIAAGNDTLVTRGAVLFRLAAADDPS